MEMPIVFTHMRFQVMAGVALSIQIKLTPVYMLTNNAMLPVDAAKDICIVPNNNNVIP